MNLENKLLNEFISFNKEKRMASDKKKTLLAVSGGMDSIVLCNLFNEAKFPFVIAHCNFQLRGAESDADEQFVKDYSKKLSVHCYVKKFNTSDYAKHNRVSIQVAARDLRYAWFKELWLTAQSDPVQRFDFIATAHHLNDNIETILFNFVKGTGIRGLRGIALRNEMIIRPLLFASREQIQAYQIQHALDFREDSSNEDDYYTRNKIRHHVVPVLKEINPSLENTLKDKIDLLTSLEELYNAEVAKSSSRLFIKRGRDIYIPLVLLKHPAKVRDVMYEFLKNYGFNPKQVNTLIQSIDAEPGKQFLSETSRIIKDRRFYILTQLQDTKHSTQFIYPDTTEVHVGENLLRITTGAKIPTQLSKLGKSEILVDSSKLDFPLLVRPWKQGDYFYPFGMKMKKKKIRKFCTDEKIPLHEKEKLLVLESNKKIVWVINYRPDERFKVSEQTKSVYKLEWK